MPVRPSHVAAFALRVRVPNRRSLLVLVVSVLAWIGLWLSANTLISLGRYTRLGPGLVGVVFPLLVLEAVLFERRRWRTRLFNTLQFAVPVCSLLVLYFGSYLAFKQDLDLLLH